MIVKRNEFTTISNKSLLVLFTHYIFVNKNDNMEDNYKNKKLQNKISLFPNQLCSRGERGYKIIPYEYVQSKLSVPGGWISRSHESNFDVTNS